LFIDEVTHEAVSKLGANGMILPAVPHSCSECTQKYKIKVDFITGDDPAALMVVVDGIVMGPTHFAYGDCTSALGNAQGGVFFPVHEAEYGTKCHIKSCTNTKKVGTLACTIPGHQEQWSKNAYN
ncbi:hypothetical protein K443DRAFT_109521, partial [Laccaria amethystina LaAM-08-1]